MLVSEAAAEPLPRVARGIGSASSELRGRASQLTFSHVTVSVKLKPVKGEKLPPTKLILDNVSGTLGPSECIAVMGPSGCGKTTLLNALAALSTPTSGHVRIDGAPVHRALMRDASAIVPQHSDELLMPVLSASEALMDAAAFKTRYTCAQAQERVDQLLRQFGLWECRHVRIGHPEVFYFSTHPPISPICRTPLFTYLTFYSCFFEGRRGLSGGQRKRLSVALELLGRPRLLFLDEPTSGLDAVSAHTLVKLVGGLAKQGTT